MARRAFVRGDYASWFERQFGHAIEDDRDALAGLLLAHVPDHEDAAERPAAPQAKRIAGRALLGVLALIPVGRLLPPTVALGLAAAVVIATLVLGLQRKAHGAMPVADPA
jgi:hypothetical protein